MKTSKREKKIFAKMLKAFTPVTIVLANNHHSVIEGDADVTSMLQTSSDVRRLTVHSSMDLWYSVSNVSPVLRRAVLRRGMRK